MAKKGNFQISKVADKIYLAEFKSLKDMGLSFVRFQEFYESPKFRGKIFKLKTFKKWYAKEYGALSYCTDWEGYNIPGWILKVFEHGSFDPLSKRERKLLRAASDIPEPFYLIGTIGFDTLAIKHEIAHGFFYTQPSYRHEVEQTLRDVDTRPVEEWMLKKGYCKEVLVDELHAYLGVDRASLLEDFSIPSRLKREYDRVGRKLRRIYNEWYRLMKEPKGGPIT